MWDKEFDVARWNGVEINILKTDREKGKRLQIDEMPYAQTPYTKVMGDKAGTYKIEIVFVGPKALNQKADFVDELESNPAGYLEHPYYGELELTYEKSSESISTRKGLVVLTCDFVLTGRAISIPPLSKLKATNLTGSVLDASVNQFEKEVAAASPDKIVSIQNNFTTMLGGLRRIANQAGRPGVALAALHRQINDGFAAISSIANAPASFAKQVQAISQSLVSQIKTLPDSANSLTNPKSYALNQVRETESTSEVQHIRMQSTMTSIQLSEAIEIASSSETATELSDQTSNIDQVKLEASQIQTSVNERMSEASGESSFESLALFDALCELNTEIANQITKIESAELNLKRLDIYSPTPSICLAYMSECALTEFEGMNAINHPLFIAGKVRVPRE